MSIREESIEARFLAHPGEKIQTTLGELVEALTQVAVEAGNTEREGYELASLALADLLQRRGAQAKADAARGRRKTS
ncbi:MAG: hypothetical protein EBZ48_07050 [Proteobacteria bacterium]|nr:hypothetical protein [Pseudomonadota bacterium]